MWCIVGGIVFGMFGFPFLFSFSWYSTGIPSVFLASSIFQFGIRIVAVTVITIRTRYITVTWFAWGWDIFFRFPFAILFQFLPYTFLNMLAQQVKGHLEFFFATSTSVRVRLVVRFVSFTWWNLCFLFNGFVIMWLSPSLWVWLRLRRAIVLLFLFWCKKDFFIGAVIHL